MYDSDLRAVDVYFCFFRPATEVYFDLFFKLPTWYDKYLIEKIILKIK